MSTPLVTIGLPFFNPGQNFKLTLQSIFAQTFSDWELLLIDDGSQDGSVEFAKSLTDPRVRVICDGHNKKLNKRLNEAIALARGEYFFRMDADDIMHPKRIERQLEVLSCRDDRTVVGSLCYSIDEQSCVVGSRRGPNKQQSGFQARHSFIHPTVAARTRWFQANPYSEGFVFHRSQDAELWCRTTDSSTFLVLNEPLLYYRELGTFSYANYLGTSLGILYLCHEYSPTTAKYAYQVTKELGKCWLTSLLWRCGKATSLIKTRFTAIPETERLIAEQLLDEIKRQTLPVRRGPEASTADSLRELCA